MLHLTTLHPQPLYRFYVASIVPGGGGHSTVEIPMLSAVWPDLPHELDALLIAGDLQAIASAHVPLASRLLSGISIAAELETLADAELLCPCARTGVLLTGDLYTDLKLNKRGSTGDVQEVWEAFARRFRWVVGVAGNHDLFYGKNHCTLPRRGALHNAHLLNGDTVVLDGLRLAGVSGIVGPPHKPWRWEEGTYLNTIAHLLADNPHALLLHESPRSPNGAHPGRSNLTETILGAEAPQMTISGHVYWEEPLVEADGFQFLNTEARMVYVTREAMTPL
ncbi:MAG: hypothetical protein AAFX99_05790 [Myxococcota bacterium]